MISHVRIILIILWIFCSSQVTAICRKFSPSVEQKLEVCASRDIPAVISRFSINDVCCKTQCEDEPQCQMFYFNQTTDQCRMSQVPDILILPPTPCDVKFRIKLKKSFESSFRGIVKFKAIEVNFCFLTQNENHFNSMTTDNFTECSKKCQKNSDCGIFSFNSETKSCKLGNQPSGNFLSFCTCNSADADKKQMVYVLLSEENNFKGCKVPLDQNLASMSSTYLSFTADRVVKTNCEETGQDYLTSTDLEVNPGWKIDLEKFYDVHKIVVTVRNHDINAAAWFSEAYAFVTEEDLILSDDIDFSKHCSYFKGPATQHQNVDFSCNRRGRFVAIVLKKTEYLELCDIVMYGIPDD